MTALDNKVAADAKPRATEAGTSPESAAAPGAASRIYIDEEVRERRSKLGDKSIPADASRKWGLALSGGGIRSATFCFGLLQALAKSNLLLRFDILSTVSGGGYIGSTLGRLFSWAKSTEEVQAVQSKLAKADGKWFLWWLRANGRYLIPRGAADTTFVAALFLRNLVGVHFELGLVAVTLGMALAALDLGVWSRLVEAGYDFPDGFRYVRWLADWIPTAWLTVLPALALVGLVIGSAYWAMGVAKRGDVAFWLWIMVFLLWAFCFCAWLSGGLLVEHSASLSDSLRVKLYGASRALHEALHNTNSEVGDGLRSVLWIAILGLVGTWLLALPLAALYLFAARQKNELRASETANTWLTRHLAFVFRIFILVAIAGLVDRTAWFLAFEFKDLARAGVGLAAAAAVVRIGFPLASNLIPGKGGTAIVVVLGRILGYALAFGLAVWWVSLVHRAVLGSAFTRGGLAFQDAWVTMAMVFVPAFVYLLLTGRDVDFLNASSLHAFYKARLVRSYLGAANGHRFDSALGLGSLEKVPRKLPASWKGKEIESIRGGDDIAMDKYRPQAHGGPIHIINVCVNQTEDPRGGLFNQDRRGLALAVASGGKMQKSVEGWKDQRDYESLSLGSWMAISGAAIAPGLGSMTRGGISALMTFAGVRLGYWWDLKKRANGEASGFTLKRFAAKPLGLLRETFGQFDGSEGADWFLTDGGHFENTGAYVLLAERTEVIVIADCGADPKYEFGDLENLVRKARIDLRTEIYFQRPHPYLALAERLHRATTEDSRPAVLEQFGSLDDLKSPTSTACLALARIEYPGGRRGVMIVVKPNTCAGLPIDLVNFKAQNKEFPQQTTADQFFSEAQWESYFHLGYFLGAGLNKEFIEGLVENRELYFEDDDCRPFAAKSKETGDAPKPNGTAISRLPSRISTATAVSTTLSLGAIATLSVGVWQALDGFKTSQAKQLADERGALKELTDIYGEASPADKPERSALLAGKLAAALVRTADNLCPNHEAAWFTRSQLAQNLYQTAVSECSALDANERPFACTELLNSQSRIVEGRVAGCLPPSQRDNSVPPPHYWAYDYSTAAFLASAHPCDPVAFKKREMARTAAGGASLTEDAALAARSGPCKWTGILDLKNLKDRGVPIADPAAQEDSPPAKTQAKRTAALGPVKVCQGITVYMQIYGPERRNEARQIRPKWQKLGANVPQIEDVLATARDQRTTPPPAAIKPVIRFHDEASIACALAIYDDSGGKWLIEPLSPLETPSRNVVDVVFPPALRPKSARTAQP
ncbi:patatin-like phospholipase family protein [Variovorax sp. J22R24]|uniref:patatin-like phospholipase family protein n=1 Tax=Variovorax gracilis TaxID=3053502 RepID=UPI00257714A3|nr:patatin-like phospholipase family protein [Variovorax sp. J22R24]MDM0109779.1 patatin-like phospholipase family protein [Variovorax sp. J22R24]